MGRVVELGSLIWLNSVKRTLALRSGNLLFFPVARLRGCIESGAGTLFLRLSNAEMRESTRAGLAPGHEVINRSRSDAASVLSLGTRFGLVTALNDHQDSRLTGSLPLVQFSFAGCVFLAARSLSSFVCILKASSLSSRLPAEPLFTPAAGWPARGAGSPSARWPRRTRPARAPARPPPRWISCAPGRPGVCNGRAAGFARPRRRRSRPWANPPGAFAGAG